MPIYEFYCPHCHTVFNFLSRSVNTTTTPACPACTKDDMTRRVSRFAWISRAGDDASEDAAEDENLPVDEATLEHAVGSLASEAEHIDENDPKAMAGLMRKFSSMTGIEYNDTMEAALSKLEAGQDPEQIEQEMGDALEGDDLPFRLRGQKPNLRTMLPPKHDDTLYEM